MQRSRRRKLQREAKRDPQYLLALTTRDAFRHIQHGLTNRAQRRSGKPVPEDKADLITKVRRSLRQLKGAI